MLTDSPEGPVWEVSPSNLAWVEELYLAYRNDPASVDEVWRVAFQRLDGAASPQLAMPASTPLVPVPASPEPSPVHGSNGNGNGGHHAVAHTPVNGERHVEATLALTPAANDIAAVAAQRALGGKRVRRLIEDYREVGHLAADLDPLKLLDRSKNRIRIEDYGLEDRDLDTLVTSEDIAGSDAGQLRDVLAQLQETYCRTIGVELGHIHDGELRGWLQHRMESTRNRVALTRSEQLHLLAKVTEAEVFEHFLQTKFIGAKRFSVEGAESLIPLVDRVIERAAHHGVTQIVIGMAHRGRLNVLAHVLNKPAAEIFAEFLDPDPSTSGDAGGDVKYHLGYSTDRVTAAGRVHLSLAFNPSHLEWVNTVVQGRMRAKQDRIGDKTRTRGLPVLIHGDAAFAGQGIVAEAFNMSGLEGYNTGGTIHIVVNNQIGFTTGPRYAYSTTYPTDVARMLQIPIFHVNGEDPEAVAAVVDLAVEFRQRFQRDVVIDMWCYRKLGHNEADEPSYTQPVMYRAIHAKASTRHAYVQAFEGMPTNEPPVTSADGDAIATARRQALDEALAAASKLQAAPRPSTFGGVWSRVRGGPESTVHEVPTEVSREAFAAVGKALTTLPAGFTPHPKIAKLLEARAAMGSGSRPITWDMGELLAFGTLVGEGVRVRMAGQDVRRGTFSHRHATLLDYVTGAEYTPLEHVAPGQGSFEIRDSPLTEGGVLGFEYGYSLDMPEGLVIWEAQFGDFVNAAQVIIDQFLVSSEAKWRRVSGLVMLLPHAMEGQGPEHSSGRLERFLNMCVNDNIQVCNVTSPAQMFHLLRRQVLRPYRKPLVVMSPKGLLRTATSSAEEFISGGFRHVIPDESGLDPKKIERVLLCSGKVYYDLVKAREQHKLDNVAIIRIEQLYPLRRDELLEALSVYPEGIRVIWVQEEARNMGAWYYMSRNIPPLILSSFHWSGISRQLSASPAVGSKKRSDAEHTRLMEDALGVKKSGPAR